MESPLIGNGFDSGVRYSGLLIGHLHNSYFQILANSGLLGFLPWLAMLMIVVYKILHQLLLVIRKKTANLEQEKVAMVLFVTLIALLGRSLTGSVLVSHSWSLLLFLSMILELAWLEGKLRRGSHDKNNRPIGPARSTRLPKAG